MQYRFYVFLSLFHCSEGTSVATGTVLLGVTPRGSADGDLFSFTTMTIAATLTSHITATFLLGPSLLLLLLQ